MGELTIRRNREVVVNRYQSAGRTEKSTGASKSKEVTGSSTGLTISETLKQLMSRVSRAENQSRESHRTLQKGEAALDEVQNALGRIAELVEQAAGDSAPDRAALQAELEKLSADISRMISSAAAGNIPMFLDECGVEDGTEALMYAVTGEGQTGQMLPDWLAKGITQNAQNAEQLLYGLGLDRTASGGDLLAAVMNSPLDGSSAVGYLATLYLGAVIAGGTLSPSADTAAALKGLHELLAKVADGFSPDRAVEILTNGVFSDMADLQSQLSDGTAPGLEDFLVGLLLSDNGSLSMPGSSLPTILNMMSGMNQNMELDIDLMLNLLSVLPLSGGGNAYEGAARHENGAAPADAAPVNAEIPAEAAQTASPAETGASGSNTILQFGDVRILGRDLSGVSFSAGEITVSGTQNVVIQGREIEAIVIKGSGNMTVQNVNASKLIVDTADAHVYSLGENVLGEVQMRRGGTLTLDGGGFLRIGALRGDESNAVRLTGGAVTMPEEGQTGNRTNTQVILDGAAVLSSWSGTVMNSGGVRLEPFDVIWKTLLPGFGSLESVTADGERAKMLLLAGSNPNPVRLWLPKGDASSHGYPAHLLVFRGRDEDNHLQTRYAYLRWNQRMGMFQQINMYPNPFTVTGGEQGRDWVYEEETCTLRILSNEVSAIAGGTGVDANQTPFSGRIALADSIGRIGLSLSNVVCRVSAGSAFSLGRENEVTLLLMGGTGNVFESGEGFAGISVGGGTSLCIDCDSSKDGRWKSAGMLTANGGEGGAGIGRDSNSGKDCDSRILIRGGIITASGTGGGAGIGAGKHGTMGTITIAGGTVNSTGGKGGGAGIGGGLGASVGDININGGDISASALYHAAAIGAGVQGTCGDIRITGRAKIIKALGGDPGADIGACLFGGCGRVIVSGAADIGVAKLRTQTGIALRMGENTVTLPQFRLSGKALQLDKLCVKTQKDAEASRTVVDADCRWVSRIQEAYGAFYKQLERSFVEIYSIRQYVSAAEGRVRDTATANSILSEMRQSALLKCSKTMNTHGKRNISDIQNLLR